jgi:hypothetical protein
MTKKIYTEPRTDVTKIVSVRLMALADGTLSHIGGGANAMPRRTRVF